jgi:lipoate-protein ligase A
VTWTVTTCAEPAAALHARVPAPAPGERLVWVASPLAPALVLGSAQPDDAVDRRIAVALGVDVARRRSGGGAVLVLPGEILWVDLVITPDDPLWDDDVARAMHWVGDTWVAALGTGAVHRGTMIRTAWSAAVCFAGTGPGEVVDERGAKLVGISQRRTRSWARFQTMVHLRWRPELVAALVAPPRPTAEELAEVTATVSAPPDVVVESLLRHLP